MSALTEEDFAMLQSQLMELKTQNYDLTAKLKAVEAEKEKLRMVTSQYKAEVSKLSAVVQRSRDKLALSKLNQEKEDLERQLEESRNDSALQVEALRGNLTALSTLHSELEAENKHLRDQLSGSGVNVQEMDKQLRAELEALKEEHAQVLEAKEDLQQDLDMASTDVMTLETEISDLRRERESTKADVAEWKQKIGELAKTMATRNEENEVLKAENTELRSKMEAARAAEAQVEFEAEKSRLNKSLESAQDTIMELEKARDAVRAEKDSMARENRREKEQLQQELASCQGALAKCEEALARSNEALAAKGDECEVERTAKEQTEAQLGEKNAQMEEQTKELEETRASEAQWMQKSTELEEQLSQAQSKLEELQEEKSSFDAQMDDFRSQYKVAERKNVEMIRELKSQVQKLRKEIKSMEAQGSEQRTASGSPRGGGSGTSPSSGGRSQRARSQTTALDGTPSKGREWTAGSEDADGNGAQGEVEAGGEAEDDGDEEGNGGGRMGRARSLSVAVGPKLKELLKQGTQKANSLNNTSPASATVGMQRSQSVSSSAGTVAATNTQLQYQQELVKQLQKENDALIAQLTTLKQERYELQDRVTLMERDEQMLKEDLEKKGTLLQHYMSKEKAGALSTPEMDAQRMMQASKGGVMGSLFGSSHAAANNAAAAEASAGSDSNSNSSGGGTSKAKARWAALSSKVSKTLEQAQSNMSSSGSGGGLSDEINAHLQRVMEDTVLRNMQLTDDIAKLGDEVDRLSTENKQLRAELLQAKEEE